MSVREVPDIGQPTLERPASRNIRWREQLIEGLIHLAGISAVLIIGLIFLFLLREGLPALLDIPLRQIFLSSRWYPIEEKFGILPLVYGSVLVTLGAVVIAVPLDTAWVAPIYHATAGRQIVKCVHKGVAVLR